MGRSVIGLCATAGTVAGGYLPELWGASGFSLAAIAFSVVGGIAGIWFGLRLSEV